MVKGWWGMGRRGWGQTRTCKGIAEMEGKQISKRTSYEVSLVHKQVRQQMESRCLRSVWKIEKGS